MNTPEEKVVVVITGPTAVGKTEISIDIASIYNSEIISADSRQFYRELKIGTAVPSQEQQRKVKHHLIGHLSIQEYYNASMFEHDALKILEDLFKRGNIAFITGGSGLYIDAICTGIDDLPEVDHNLRSELARSYQTKGLPWLRTQLRLLDPEHYNVVDLKNPNRMLKAIEITLMTGNPYSSFLKSRKKTRNFKTVKIGLNIQRNLLYEKIDRRVDEMVSEGLIKEAKGLLEFRNLNALKTVGYRELFDHFENRISLERAIELIKRNSRRYAKRQLTWFARDPDIKWFNPKDKTEIIRYINDITGTKL